jgi:hypothetical protein
LRKELSPSYLGSKYTLNQSSLQTVQTNFVSILKELSVSCSTLFLGTIIPSFFFKLGSYAYFCPTWIPIHNKNLSRVTRIFPTLTKVGLRFAAGETAEADDPPGDEARAP